MQEGLFFLLILQNTKKSPRTDKLSRFENGVYVGAIKEMALIYARG
jgi:hypothetical protein